jgi:hypothetical protein
MKTQEKPGLKERRPLIEGIKPSNVDRSVEEKFVYSGTVSIPRFFGVKGWTIEG